MSIDKLLKIEFYNNNQSKSLILFSEKTYSYRTSNSIELVQLSPAGQKSRGRKPFGRRPQTAKSFSLEALRRG